MKLRYKTPEDETKTLTKFENTTDEKIAKFYEKYFIYKQGEEYEDEREQYGIDFYTKKDKINVVILCHGKKHGMERLRKDFIYLMRKEGVKIKDVNFVTLDQNEESEPEVTGCFRSNKTVSDL